MPEETSTPAASTTSKFSAKKLLGIIAIIVVIILVGGYIAQQSAAKNRVEAIKNAEIAWREGKADIMLLEADKALKLATTDIEKSEAHYWKGVGYYRLLKFPEAEAEIQQSITLNPEFAKPYVTMGALYTQKNMMKEAETMASTSIKLDPNFAWGYNLLGSIYMNRGLHNEGIALVKKAIELDPSEPMFKDNLSIMEKWLADLIATKAKREAEAKQPKFIITPIEE